jgi:spore coat protein U-like protein
MRKLGQFEVDAIGLGCMNLSHAYGVPPTRKQGGPSCGRRWTSASRTLTAQLYTASAATRNWLARF